MKNLKQFLFLLLTLFFSTKNYSQCQTTLLTLSNQVTESFEGIPISASNPTYFNGYSIPITSFSFPSGLILSFPSPNTSGGALLCDFAKASATWGLCSSSIASPANVPTGNAFLGLNSSTGNALFTLPYVTSDIGLLVESCVGVITLTTYDSSNNIINSCTRNGTGNVANWVSSYLGFHSSSSNIKSFRIQGNFVALDNIKWSGPTIITCPGNITTTTTGQCGKNVSFIATATGTPTPSITYSPASGSFFNIGTTTVTATATNSGGSASCTFTVTVNDTQPPSLAVVPAVPHVYDDYGRKSTFTNINLGGTGTNVTRVAPSASVSLTFNRSTILTGACPGCITQHYVGIAGVWASQCLFSTTGASSGSHSFTFTAPSTPGVYYITRRGSWEFSCISVPMPSSRNAALAVLIVGNSSACPDNVVVNADPGQCGAVVSSANPTIIDNCPGGTVVQTAGLPSGSLYPVGTTTNTFLATDASGNTATCSYTVTVNDTQPPVITCPSNITVSNTVGQCSANVSFAATATDNCGTATLSYSPASGSLFSVGTTTVTATANDGHGNTASCTFTVTVNDTQAPVVTCPANIVVSNTHDQCGAKVCYTTPVVVENCIPATPAGYTYKTNYGTSYYYQSNVLMNYTTAQSSATAAGGHLAVITSAAENSALSSSGAGFGWLGGNDLDANDVWVLATCEPFSYNNWCSGEPNGGTFENHLEFESGGCWNDLVETALRYSIIEIEGAKLTQTAGLAQNAFFPVGTTTNTFLATDASGNTATCSFTVTVNDTQPPVITCPSNITVSNTVGQCGANVSFAATATDNCGTATLSYSPASGSLFTIGTTTVTATADRSEERRVGKECA